MRAPRGVAGAFSKSPTLRLALAGNGALMPSSQNGTTTAAASCARAVDRYADRAHFDRVPPIKSSLTGIIQLLSIEPSATQTLRESSVMRHDLASIPEAVETRAGRTKLLSRLYRDIGLAAVAAELQLPAQEFDLEVGESIERGSRYLPPKIAARAS
jgi:hypothetical protein